ncbi:MAG: 2'-5' RNA ligase family protein [Bacteroidales bacterium]|nr:2'-5' RNA ligase family protein [Bacteroidales bacterium]
MRNERSVDLYFIALMPHEELRDEIRAIKERMRECYGAGHALRSPAHITLQKPFRRDSDGTRVIIDALHHFAQHEVPFKIELYGYGAFAPRVLYIKLKENKHISLLQERLKAMLLSSLAFTPDEISKDIQPHITIATRDLTKEAFGEAWPGLRDEVITGSFVARSFFLLKHNGRYWDIFREFPFKGDE